MALPSHEEGVIVGVCYPQQIRFLNPQLPNGPVDDDRDNTWSTIPATEAADLVVVFACLLAFYWFSAARL
jgi:hypothetical protein